MRRRHEHDESKYSAEEKVVEDSEDEEEVAKRTVAERREKIQKRLSSERQIAPSTQKKEIDEEITSIKRQSLIDDTRAKHEEEIVMQKPVDNSYKSSVIPESVVKLKTTTLDSSSIDKQDFEKELQDKFHKTLGDVDKFEHKFEPKSETIVTKTTEVISSAPNAFNEQVVKTVETTYTEVRPDTESKLIDFDEEPIATKQTETITTTYTDEDGYVKEEKKVIHSDKKIAITDDFIKMEKEAINKEFVQDILDEARSGAEKIQNKLFEIGETTSTSVQQSGDNIKETITTTTTTVRTIESINLDNVIEDQDYDDESENFQQTKIIETGEFLIEFS